MSIVNMFSKLKPVDGLGGEFWGGLAATLVALPSSVAFGIAIYTSVGSQYAAQGATAGILGAIALGITAPLLGGASRLISAPCAPAAAVISSTLAGLAVASAGAGTQLDASGIIGLMTLAGLLAGVLQFIYGAVGGGRIIKYIPYPVVAGYLSGVALTILIGQLPKWLGLPDKTLLIEGIVSPGMWKWQAIVVGSATVAGMVLAPRLTKVLPAPIVGMGVGVAAYFALGIACPELLELKGNKLVVGAAGGGASSVFKEMAGHWRAATSLPPSWFVSVLVLALMLSVLLSIDTLKTCVVLDALTRTRHNSNRTLLGQGLGNFISAVVGGIPGAGTMGASLVNMNSGGKTRLSGVFEGVFVLVAFLALSSFMAWIPISALAGILIVVACKMFDWESLHLLRRRSTVVDFSVIAVVVVVAVWKDLVTAAGVGLGLAILLFMREQMRGPVIRRKVHGGQISSKKHRLPAEKEILLEAGRATTVCELQGSLFFGTTDQLFTELEADLKISRHLILDMRRVRSVDFTAAHMLEQIESMLTERKARLIFSNLPVSLPNGQDLLTYFDHVGLVKPNRNVKVFDSMDEALEWTEDRVLEEAQAVRAEHEKPLDLAEIELVREFEEDGTLEALRSCVHSKSFAAGETIFKQGDVGDELYLVRRGIVRVVLPLEHGKNLNLATFGQGNFFGEMAFLDRGTRSADAVVITATDVYILSRGRFNEVAREHPILAVKMFARLARALAIRLRHTDQELRALQEC